jgi:radical SAM protein with 4Fe4S-binding SPASM domain
VGRTLSYDAHSDLDQESLLSATWRAAYLRVRYEPFLKRYLTAYRGDTRPRILNQTGAVVTAALLEGKALREAIDLLERRCPGVGRERITADALAFVRNLLKRGAVEIAAPEGATTGAPMFDKGSTAPSAVPLAERCSFRVSALPPGVENCFSVPDRVQIEVTKRCNLGCRHCYVPGTAGQDEDDLPTESLFALIDRLDRWGVFTLELSGGEALLRRDICDVIEYAARRCLAVVLYTNGTMLRPVLSSRLVSMVSCFAISLDGAQQCHDAVRGMKGAFAETTRAITEAASLGARVTVSYTLTPETEGDAEDVRRLVHDLGAERFLCSPPTPMGRAQDLSLTLADYHRLLGRAMSLGEPRHPFGQAETLLPREFTCAAAKTFFFVSADGRMYPCPFFSFEGFDFGDAALGDLEQRWFQAPVLRRFRDVRPLADPRCTCKTCPMWCRALHYHVAGQLEGDPSSYCPRLRAQTP